MKITKKAKVTAAVDDYDLDSIDWYENYESHPLADLFYEALDKLGLEAEPSIQGGVGSDYFYDENGETVGSVDYGDERSFMDDLAFEYVQEANPNNQKYVNAIKDWLSEIIQADEDDEVGEAIESKHIDYIDNYKYTGGQISNELKPRIRSVVVASGVTQIDDDAFHDCDNLTSVTIPDTIKSIGDHAFSGCSSLTSLMIPDSVTSIGRMAFYGCSSLTNIKIPDSVTSISMGAFSDCSSLKSVTISDSVTSIGGVAFSRCKSLKNVTIPDSVTSIGRYAFSWCSSLTSITIPNSVTSISAYAFDSCDDLTIYTNNPIAIEYAEENGIPVVSLDEDLVTL